MKDKELKMNVIQAITSPLGFFALALLIVESFLGMVLIWSNLNENHKWWGMIIGLALFVFVVSVVGLLVYITPENLSFGENSLLERYKMQKESEQKKIWGTKNKPSKKIQVESGTTSVFSSNPQ